MCKTKKELLENVKDLPEFEADNGQYMDFYCYVVPHGNSDRIEGESYSAWRLTIEFAQDSENSIIAEINDEIVLNTPDGWQDKAFSPVPKQHRAAVLASLFAFKEKLANIGIARTLLGLPKQSFIDKVRNVVSELGSGFIVTGSNVNVDCSLVYSFGLANLVTISNEAGHGLVFYFTEIRNRTTIVIHGLYPDNPYMIRPDHIGEQEPEMQILAIAPTDSIVKHLKERFLPEYDRVCGKIYAAVAEREENIARILDARRQIKGAVGEDFTEKDQFIQVGLKLGPLSNGVVFSDVNVDSDGTVKASMDNVPLDVFVQFLKTLKPKIELVGESVQYAGRDMVLVKMGSKLQPFYRSSGRNSKKAGEWLPFDGCIDVPLVKGWFDKRSYCFTDNTHPLHRYGTEELKGISVELGALQIPESTNLVDDKGVNQWIARHRSKMEGSRSIAA